MGKIAYSKNCLELTPGPNFIILGPQNSFLMLYGVRKDPKMGKNTVFGPKMGFQCINNLGKHGQGQLFTKTGQFSLHFNNFSWIVPDQMV